MARKLGFGIIGCGMISEFHINAIGELSDKATLVGITDTVRDNAERLSSRHSGLYIFDSVEDMLASRDIHAVCICVPSGYHADIIYKAAAAKKHIMVEKPLAITKEQLDEIQRVVGENRITLAVVSQLRFAKDINRAKYAIQSGELGKILCADMYMKYYRSQEYYDSGAWRGTKRLDGGGALMNQGIHGVDILQYLAGEIKSVFAFSKTLARKIEVEDTLCASVEFESGAIGVIQATTSVYPGYPRRIEINGDRGSIIIEETALTRMDIDGHSSEDLTFRPAFSSGSSAAMNISGDYHTLQISDFIDAVREKKKPAVDVIEGRKAVDVILAIYKSAREERRVFIEELNPKPNKHYC
ncbi:MAG: Gfo/Idh/MocA family oxidoreductase [Clostridiales bacterium]|jgi:predicted dehydrogenase|nr:Gfo/Idh/MocA family oxidoreductase [Clostridiales bacterium]